MAFARAARLLPALWLACAATAVLATRLPGDQAFVTVSVKGARRYILQAPALGTDLPVAEAPLGDTDLGSPLNAPLAAPLAPAASLPPSSNASRNASAPSRSSPNSPPDSASGLLGINAPATTSSPAPPTRSSPPPTRSSPPPARSPPPPTRSPPPPARSPPPSSTSSTTSSSQTINEDKTPADGSICNIYSRSASPRCTTDTPVPACCDEASDDAICVTYDSGANLNCVTAVPYPACCEARDQPAEVCSLPTSTGRCYTSLPVPACCDDTDCYVFPDASNVRCSSDNVAACCPA